MKHRSFQILLSIFTILLLAGCHKLEVTTRVDLDGSGEVRMGAGFSAEERANMEKQGSNPNDFCNVAQSPPNVTVIEQQRGEETWCINLTKFNDLEELRSLYEQRRGITINRLEIRDGKFYYDVDLDTLSEESSYSALTEITWLLVVPGALIEHNADQVDGNTLTWKPAPKSGIIRLYAESEVPRGKFNFPACGGAFIVVIGGVFFHLTHGRARRTKGKSE
jgi:hypothetical protein